MNKAVYLSKSDFLKYQICPSYLWLFKYNREVVPEDAEEAAQYRLEQGNEVETWARKLFPDGIMVDARFHQARQKTEELVKNGTKIIFQATVFTDRGLLAKADIIEFDDKTKNWTLYEVKSTNSVKPEHVDDVAFQKAAFEDAGYKIGKTFLVHMNKDYIRGEKLEPQQLFVNEDISEKVEKILSDIRAQAYDALESLARKEPPKGCSCRLKPRSKHCPTFAYLNPDIPEYSVFNIARLGGKKLEVLIDSEIYDVAQVPNDIKLSAIQQNQVGVTKTNEPLIDKASIADMMSQLQYPLHFLDYEAIAAALPLYKGYKPYQQIPFQYSLHTLPKPDGKLGHYEFLDQVGKSSPVPELLKNLRAHMQGEGSVIVWHKSFEAGRNTEMANTNPEYTNFLLGINERLFDLKDIFAKQHYVHPGFRGSNSIKAVLPVLIPEFSYKELSIQGGDVAAIRWYDAITGTVDALEAKKTFEALLEYCRLDTLAMVKIHDKLQELIK
ncbi:MAG: DUF2779 domain-containing protein [Candidatus Saccharimonadales bacterium]